MVVWDLVCTWRRSLVFLARGLCACSLAALYVFVGCVLCSGYHPARDAPTSNLRLPPGEESTGSSPPSVAEEGSSATSETTPFNAHCHPRFASRRPLVLNQQESTRPLVIPKIVVQDFSAEDGSVCYKTPEYDLTHSLKRRRRARAPTTLGAHLLFNTRPSPLGFPSTVGVSAVGGLRPLPLVDGFKYRRPDALVQNLLGFPGGKRVDGDVVAKDGSFVIVGL